MTFSNKIFKFHFNRLRVDPKLLTILPVDGVVEIDADCVDIHPDDEEEVEAHAKIGNRQVDH